jgi:hypothetical protein
MSALPASARADVIVYNNFGAGNGGNDYQTAVGWTVGNDFSGDNVAIGEKFTPSTTGTLSQIILALEYVAGPNAGTVSLRADNAGVPGATLESFSVSSLPPSDSNFHTPLDLVSVTQPALSAGTPYWIVASTTIASSLSWMFNNTSATASHATSFDGGTTWVANNDTQGAFRVTENLRVTTGVPEPSTLALLSIGLGAFASKRLRRR